MSSNPKFYTYMYLRKKDATAWYVGKGRGRRAFEKHHGRRPPETARILVQYWESEREALDMEKFYIRLWGRKDNGTGILWNLTDGGEGVPGSVHSQEFREMVRNMNRHRQWSQESRQRLSKSRTGQRVSPETCRKISAAHKGKPHSEDHNRSVSEALKGRRFTPEHCRNISKAKKGRLRGPCSADQRKRLSEAAKRRHARQRRQRDQSTPQQLVLFIYAPIRLGV